MVIINAQNPRKNFQFKGMFNTHADILNQVGSTVSIDMQD